MVALMFSLAVWTVVSASVSTLEGISSTDTASTLDILRRIDELERRDQEQKKEIESLRGENAELKHLRETNDELVAKIERLGDRIKLLEDRESVKAYEYVQENPDGKDVFKNEIINSEADPEKAINSNRGAGKEQVIFPSDIRKISKVLIKQGHSRIRQLDQGSTAAFFATRSSSHAEHLGQHQPIVFDRTITNVGLGYHNSTGTFIAPVSGVYVFSTTILTFTESAHFQFAVNGHAYSNMVSFSSETYETLGQTAIFVLAKGDDVAIQNADADKFVHGFDYSTFSGFLLASTEGDVVVG